MKHITGHRVVPTAWVPSALYVLNLTFPTDPPLRRVPYPGQGRTNCIKGLTSAEVRIFDLRCTQVSTDQVSCGESSGLAFCSQGFGHSVLGLARHAESCLGHCWILVAGARLLGKSLSTSALQHPWIAETIQP